MNGPSQKEQALLEEILSFKYDPPGFVLYAFPWGVKGTPLENYPRPRKWQFEVLQDIKDHLAMDLMFKQIGIPSRPFYLSLSSGRGIGKSALIAMLNYWMVSCWWGGTAIVTANTETQLRVCTLAEVGKWHTMAINRHWFQKSSLSLKPTAWFADLLMNQCKINVEHYHVRGQSWSEENPDAFTGAHSTIAMMLTMDEASGVADAIWNVSDGFFTDLAELRIWVNISNPRRNTGRFYDCFHRDKSFWITRSIDSRNVEGVDSAVYQRIADKHGEDHDVTRMEVKGLFPRTGSRQFIGRESVDDARIRELVEDEGAPLLMGIDVARYGDDESTFVYRRGRDARSIPARTFKGYSTMQLAEEAAQHILKYSPDGVFVDGNGVGGGVVDRLRQLGFAVEEVQAGERADEPIRFKNKRIEMWDRMREWLKTACICPNNDDLALDLTGPEYEVDDKGRAKLESKDIMKRRGLDSPDHGDALAMTFAKPMARLDMRTSRVARLGGRHLAQMDYNVI